MDYEEYIAAEEESEISLQRIMAVLISKKWVILLSTVIFACAFLSYAVINQKGTSQANTMNVADHTEAEESKMVYISHATFYPVCEFTNTKNKDAEDEITFQKSVLPTFLYYLRGDTTIRSIADTLTSTMDDEILANAFELEDNRELNISDINKCISIGIYDNTEVFYVTATTRDPDVSAAICNILVKKAPDQLKRVSKIKPVTVKSVVVIDPAVASAEPVEATTSHDGAAAEATEETSDDSGIKISKKTGLLIGAVVGFALSCFVIVVIEIFSQTVKNPRDLSKKYDIPILGEIVTKERKLNFKLFEISLAPNTHQSDNTSEYVADEFRNIRTRVNFLMSSCPNKTIAVSSANPDEGKSKTAAILANAFAQTGSKVLLIDADMRNPVQHRIFKTKNKRGLSTLIADPSSKESSINSNVVNHLDLITSGPKPTNPSELILTDSFSDLLEQFKEDYDYVVIDTPAVNEMSDALVIGNMAGGTILNVMYEKTKYDDIDDVMSQIKPTAINLLGFVIDGIYDVNCYNRSFNKHLRDDK